MIKLARISSKGQVVIPAPLRKALRIKRTVIIRQEDGKIVLEPSSSMEEAFGTGGKEMVDAAIEITQERRKEVESER